MEKIYIVKQFEGGLYLVITEHGIKDLVNVAEIINLAGTFRIINNTGKEITAYKVKTENKGDNIYETSVIEYTLIDEYVQVSNVKTYTIDMSKEIDNISNLC